MNEQYYFYYAKESINFLLNFKQRILMRMHTCMHAWQTGGEEINQKLPHLMFKISGLATETYSKNYSKPINKSRCYKEAKWPPSCECDNQ